MLPAPTKKVLNVGGGSKAIAIPALYDGFEHQLLDVDPAVRPDILCDARQLGTRPAAQFEAVYCSHNLEHYHRHDVPKVLAGFLHVLKPEGFAHILVPDLPGLMREVIERGMGLEDEVYRCKAGPITVLDMIYGYGRQIEHSGQDFFAHKTGFSLKTLSDALLRAGFVNVYGRTGRREISVLAFKQPPDPETRARFGLPADG